MAIHGIPPDDLDVLIARAEEAFARAVREVFRRGTSYMLKRSEPAPPADALAASLASVDPTDAVYVETLWREQVPGLSNHVAAVYGASAYTVATALVSRAGVDITDVWDVSARVSLDARAKDYLTTATNRMVRTGTEMWSAIRSELVSGFQAGEGIPALSNRLRSVSEISQRRARAVARTEVVGASNAGAMAGASAFPGLQPETKTWLATSDARTRPTHQSADGQTVPFDKPFQVGGVSMDRPHAPGAPAAEVVNCRCTVVFSDPAEMAALPPVSLSAAEQRRLAAANAHGVSVEQVRASEADVAALRARIRAEAAEVQADSLGWLDRADAMRIRKPPPRGARGGEYDWAEDLHRAERTRLTRWFSDSPIDAPDVVMHRAQAAGLFNGSSVDEFMDQWLYHTRRVDAAGAVRAGRVPSPNRFGGRLGPGDIVPSLEQEGIDIVRLLGADVEDAAGYLARLNVDEVADRAYSILGRSVQAADNAPWRMSYQSWEREVRGLDELAGERALTAAEHERYAQLVPPNLDTGQDFEQLYAEIIETARVAQVDVADWAVIPWATA